MDRVYTHIECVCISWRKIHDAWLNISQWKRKKKQKKPLKQRTEVSFVAQRLRNPSPHEDADWIPGLSQWVRDPACHGLWLGCSDTQIQRCCGSG